MHRVDQQTDTDILVADAHGRLTYREKDSQADRRTDSQVARCALVMDQKGISAMQPGVHGCAAQPMGWCLVADQTDRQTDDDAWSDGPANGGGWIDEEAPCACAAQGACQAWG
jgi:hypothetical protein